VALDAKKPTQLFKLGEMKTEVWDESIRNGDESDVPFDAACRPAGGAEAGCPIYVVVQGFEVGRVTREKDMQFAILSSDPKTGPYTQIRKVPAGTDNPLHLHRSEIKNVIISGVWYTGRDSASAKDFGLGSVIMMPADWVHVSGCRTRSDCVFYQKGKGKFDFKPVAERSRNN